MEKIKAAIIGLGRIASLLEDDKKREKPCTHAGAITANADCVLAGGCDTDEGQRKTFAERWKVPVYADAQEMIRAQNPRILVIATPPENHYEYCRLAACSDIPVVICEKPLANTLPSARKIAALNGRAGKSAEKKGGTVIITNHERRYSSDYIKAREILASEKLGAILSVRSVLYMGKSKALVDVFWHDGTHLADAIMFLTDTVLKHKRRWGVKLTSRSGTAWLEGKLENLKQAVTPNGKKSLHSADIPFIIEIGAGRDHLVFEIEISCAKGRLRIGNGIFEVWESNESPYAEKFRSLLKTGESFKGPTGYFANMLADAVACVREPGRVPKSSAADGLKVIEYLNSVKSWR